MRVTTNVRRHVARQPLRKAGCFLTPPIAMSVPLLPLVISQWGAERSGVDVWTRVLGFVYTLAHVAGQVIVNVLQSIVGSARIPEELVDPIGFLAVLTVFLGVAEVARKLTWVVVLAGWVLIVVRVVLLVWPSRP